MNTYGFNAGGPVDFWKKEHKTFFFYNMEWRSLIQGQTLNQLVPLASEYPTAAGAVFPTAITVPTGVAPSVLFANCPAVEIRLPLEIVAGSAFPKQHDSCLHGRSQCGLLAGGGNLPDPYRGCCSGSNQRPFHRRQ